MNNIEFIIKALEEDVRDGDHSTLACIPKDAMGKSKLLVKEKGVLAGIEIAKEIFEYLEPNCKMEILMQDGDEMNFGDIAFYIEAHVHTLLTGERLVLNTMQRMSGIATLTKKYADKIKEYPTQLLDTRKTTPNFRAFEKRAVKIGGGTNHRMGLYDMIMLKDNHIDFCGGIEKALDKTKAYLEEKKLNLKIEIGTRSLEDVKKVVAHGGADIIMLDNFTPDKIVEALKIIDGKFKTEASGGINFETIENFAKTGVDFVSTGAIIHHAVSMDLSLKAIK